MRKRSAKQLLIATLLFLVFPGTSYGQKLIYKEDTGGKTSLREVLILSSPTGYTVRSGYNESTTDSGFSSLEWEYRDKKTNTDISSKRRENIIIIKGCLKGKLIDTKLEIDDSPWFQFWGLGLKDFMVSEQESTIFWSINPDNLRINKFEAHKTGEESIEINGAQVKAIRVLVTLSGALARFWSAEYCFRVSDGRELKSEMKRAPMAPSSVLKLVDEQ